MRPAMTPLVAMLLSTGLAACASTDATDPARDTSIIADADAATLVGSGWQLTRLPLQDAGMDALPEPLKLRFDGERIAGNGPCNGFSAPYKLGEDGLISIGPIMATKRACDALALESVYFQALAGATRAQIAKGDLHLSGLDTALVFRRQP